MIDKYAFLKKVKKLLAKKKNEKRKVFKSFEEQDRHKELKQLVSEYEEHKHIRKNLSPEAVKFGYKKLYDRKVNNTRNRMLQVAKELVQVKKR
jgi:hypothetical protein